MSVHVNKIIHVPAERQGCIDPFHAHWNAAELEDKTMRSSSRKNWNALFCPPVQLHSSVREKGLYILDPGQLAIHKGQQAPFLINNEILCFELNIASATEHLVHFALHV